METPLARAAKTPPSRGVFAFDCTAVQPIFGNKCEPSLARVVGIGMVDPITMAADELSLPSRVRTFFALVPDESVRLQFLTLAREVARRSRGRAISGEHVHLTLAFLGDVPFERLSQLRAIGDALPLTGAVLDFDTLGAWRASGVAWVAPSQLPPSLVELHAALHRELTSAQFEMESRPFRPHVTLARRCVQPHPRSHCAVVRWPVKRLCLIGSELRPEGPRHTTLADWTLR